MIPILLLHLLEPVLPSEKAPGTQPCQRPFIAWDRPCQRFRRPTVPGCTLTSRAIDRADSPAASRLRLLAVGEGRLTPEIASEVGQLELDADWIVLSACNTAAGEVGDAEPSPGWRAPSFTRRREHCSCRTGM